MAEARLTLTAVDQTRAAFDSVKRSLGDVERTAGALSTVLAGIGAGLSAGALVGFVRQAVDAADALDDLSQKTGVTVEALSGLGYAAKIEGIGIEALGDGLRKLQVSLQDAATGSEQLRSAFAAVGITAAELRNIRADQAVERIADAFAASEDGAAKAAVAVRLFGRAGTEFIPLLNKGSAGLREASDEARRFGLIVSSQTAAAAGQFNDDLTRLQATASGLGIALANTVLPSLTRLTQQLLEGQRIFGSFGQALLSIGVGVDPFKSLADNIKGARQELELLERKRANSASEGNTNLAGFDASIARQRRVLEFLQFQQRQAIDTSGTSGLDARDLQLRNAQQQPRGQINFADQVRKAARAQSDALTDAEQIALTLQRARDREFEAMLDATARAREATQADFLRRFEEGNQLDLDAARDQAAAIERLLAGTRTGQEQAAIGDIETLNQALLVGRINAVQYEEAYSNIQDRLNEIRGIGRDTFTALADDGTQALRDLEFAIQGWGREFTDTLASALETGRLQFSDLVKSILRDLVRLQIQQSITRPLFNALQGLGAGIFGTAGTSAPNQIPVGGARASGGPVAANTAYLVGERGPELFVPRQGGTIVPNGAAVGGVTQVFNIAAGVDAGTVYRAASLGAAMAQSNIARQAAIGAMG